jgi:hypothetical protein
MIGSAGTLLAFGATVLAVYLGAPSLTSAVRTRQLSPWELNILTLGILAASAAFPIVGALFGRLGLRLELWLDDTP